MYITLQIEEIVFSFKSHILTRTHMHVMGYVLNYVGRSFDLSGET